MEYSKLISIENVFQAWEEFKKGKRGKYEVQTYERNLENNLFDLHRKLKDKTYKHGPYQDFYINDPKSRHIHKAQIADRIVHHLLYKYLYNLFDKAFIFDSYSCRLKKGIHRAVNRLEKLTRTVSTNYTKDCWALKLDIKKFFDSVNHGILLKLINKKVKDEEILSLTKEIIDSFSTPIYGPFPKGIPLGNLTSQIFANIYLNELDQFVKDKIKIKYYIRYADDFVILEPRRKYLYQCINSLNQFLVNSLRLELHPYKIVSRKLSWGIDFCGYTVLPYYKLVKTQTRRRIFKKTTIKELSNKSIQSYIGHFSHAESFKITQTFKNLVFLRQGAVSL